MDKFNRIVVALAVSSLAALSVPASAQCAGCDADRNRRDRERVQDWGERDRVRDAQERAMENSARGRLDRAGREMINRTLEKVMSRSGGD